jgi:hypothetical protein
MTVTLDDYSHYDDDDLITEEEVIGIVMGEWGVNRKQAKQLISVAMLTGNLPPWILVN